MNTGSIGLVYRKELKEALRDRRTIVSMFLVPALVMPALMFGMTVLSVKMVRKAQSETPSVMILGGGDSPDVVARLRGLKSVKIVPSTDDYAERISDKKLRAAVRIPAGFDAASGTGATPEVKIYHYQGEIRSGAAMHVLEDFFRKLRDERVRNAVVSHGLPENFVTPFKIDPENVAPPEKVGGNLFGAFVPYILIILSLTGAMYPAIDLTAGEKERGTMETILSSPVNRLDLVLGKYLLVLTAALATIVSAITSMSVSFVVGGSVIAKMVGGGAAKVASAAASGRLPFTIDPAGVLAVFALVIPVSVFFAGLLLAVALFAKSYKEAQTYVSPLLVLAVIPSVAAMMPGFELNGALAFVPVLNISLVSKEILSGVYNGLHIVEVAGSMCVYAVASIVFCFAMFNREAVLFRS